MEIIMKKELQQRITDFIQDYNTEVEAINDELEGMEMGTERKAQKFDQCKMAVIANCEDLTEEYFELKKEIKD
jgi:hypothetical protein